MASLPPASLPTPTPQVGGLRRPSGSNDNPAFFNKISTGISEFGGKVGTAVPVLGTMGHGIQQGATKIAEGVEVVGRGMVSVTLDVTDLLGTYLSRFPLIVKIFQKLNFFEIHQLYFIILGFTGALIVWLMEKDHTNITFIDALFMVYSGCCVTGLSAVDFSKWAVGTQVVMFFLIIAGSSVLLSVFPLLVRLLYLNIMVRKYQKTTNKTLEMSQYQIKETKALRRLVISILMYWLILHTFSILVIGIHLSTSAEAYAKLKTSDRHIPPFWFAIFVSVSAFQNAGFSPLQDNLAQFASDGWVLIPLSILIMGGNVGFPIFLRYGLRICAIINSRNKQQNLFAFILRNCRQLYTNLFPKKETLRLVYILIFFIASETLLILWMDWDNKVLDGLSPGGKVLSAYFTAVVTRTAGFNSINTGDLNAAVLVMMICLMYVSSYPVAVSIRSSAVHITGDDYVLFADEELPDREQDTIKDTLITELKQTVLIAPKDILTAGAGIMQAGAGMFFSEGWVQNSKVTAGAQKPDIKNVSMVDNSKGATNNVGNTSVTNISSQDPVSLPVSKSQDDDDNNSNNGNENEIEMTEQTIPSPTLHPPVSPQIHTSAPVKIDIDTIDPKVDPHLAAAERLALLAEKEKETTKEVTKGFLSRDLARVFLFLQFIAICEGNQLFKYSDPATSTTASHPGITVLSILYEIVSAYGTVGLSLGYPNTVESLSHQFTWPSKLCMVLVMFLGRHRGLPESVDKAVVLPWS